jgi:hypothetical protein
MSAPSRNLGKSFSQALGEHSPSDMEMRLREALLLWLRWNDAYERVTERLYAGQFSPEQTEAVMDEVDDLRREAIRLSHELLN